MATMEKSADFRVHVCVVCGANGYDLCVARTFLRGQNVPVDEETKRDQEEKKRKYLEHQVPRWIAF